MRHVPMAGQLGRECVPDRFPFAKDGTYWIATERRRLSPLCSLGNHGSETMIDADTPQPGDDPAPIGDPSPAPQEPTGDPMPDLGPTPPMDDDAAIEETEEQPS